jgi:acyl carrier protein
MQTDAVYAELTTVFHDVFDDDSIVLHPETTAEDVDLWDSLNHLRLVAEVEQVFQLKFSAAEVGRLKNVGEFVGLIQARQSK